MTTFNIGSQNAASIQNIAGDMTVQGGVHATASLHVVELRDRLAKLGEEIDRLDLPAATHAIAKEALDEAQAEAVASTPRSSRIAHCLRRVTDTLNDAGALTHAAVDVARTLASAVALVPLIL